MEAVVGEDGGSPEDGCLLVRIHVPELNVQKCLQFPRDQLVWDVKQQCLAALPKELKESFNYGLFSPPENGRAGKFLDEERRLGDYPFNGPVGYLELKYKRRVYKMLSIDEKQLKSLHTRTNLRRFLEYVQHGQVEKITKMCTKGLDPNFHCQDSGETPLTMATATKKPSKTLIALVNGGALLDYRTKDGSTAIHRSIEHHSLEALKTLLELGASPNYKDSRGLTPVYLTITNTVDPDFTQTLLHDHAALGAKDMQGWQEVHQACKNGLLKHLEHLLFYGADMNAQNASGNTPLHVCAVNSQESCARQLLFRGADRQALNFANQTPYQVAVIAGNMELADIIQNYRQDDVVPYRGPPCYNPKRRSAVGWLQRAPSLSTLALPPSPCPSDRSSVPFSSASSSLSEGCPMPGEVDTASIVTVLALGVADKSLGDTSDIISDSSGVGTANSDTNCSLSMPGSTVVCIESYSSKEDGHLSIREGDILEVTGATDCGYLEGTTRSGGNQSGLFPSHCVQEVRLRNHNIPPPMMIAPSDHQTRQSIQSNHSSLHRVVGRRESTSKHFSTTPRFRKPDVPSEPRSVVLHKGRKGFGFILRGAKSTSPLMELTPSEKCPGLQYLDDVDPGGMADMAGLKKGDFLLEINNEDVSSASHEHVVDLIRQSGNLVQMTVVSLEPADTLCSIPMSKSTILQGGTAEMPLSRQYATLPRKIGQFNTNSLGRAGQAPLPPRRDPKTTLSVGRARAKSLVAGLEGEQDETDELAKSSSAESIQQQYSQPRTASIKQRPVSSRVTTTELEELFQKQRDDEEQSSLMSSSRFQSNSNTLQHSSGSPVKNRVYASVAEMKRNKSKTKVRFATMFSRGSELRRDFHSTPDIAHEVALLNSGKNHRSQEDIALINRTLPPPTHPPPPPPATFVKVDHATQYAAYAKKAALEEGVVSSFRPSSNAKLYASPEDIKSVGFRSKTLQSQASRPQVRKTQSMRSNSSFKPVTASTPPTSKCAQNVNPYAQPIRTTRSHSSASSKDRRRKLSTSKSASNIVLMSHQSNTPTIPEPDYSCSESEMENEEVKDHSSLAARLSSVQLHPVENSGNSNASGSSSGSSSAAPNFSVDDIQKGRLLLKSSKSYPDDFLKKVHKAGVEAMEDGDNSSSGVSSDQEITNNTMSDYHDRHSLRNVPSPSNQKQQTGTLTRQAMKIARLTPPQEADSEFCLPPPPEYVENLNDSSGQIEVLAPPPQFSDNRQVTRVRIVGALPKNETPKSGRH